MEYLYNVSARRILNGSVILDEPGTTTNYQSGRPPTIVGHT